MARTSRSLAAAYAADADPSHQTGARKYATSGAEPYGSPRRVGTPVSAIDLAIQVSSISSEKIVGTGCLDACQA